MLSNAELKSNIKHFVEKWRGKGTEKQDDQSFWFELFKEILGVENPTELMSPQYPVMLSHTSWIDIYIPSTKVLIEQKGHDIDLDLKQLQSDKSKLTPYEQALRYARAMRYSEYPRWIVVCNFQEFRIHDMDNPRTPPVILKLDDLPSNYHCLNFLIDTSDDRVQKQEQVSFDAGEVIGRLYNCILKQYADQSDEFTLKSLNILCVRLVFCLYAEDSGLFASKTQFHDYVISKSENQLQSALKQLFAVLNTPEEKRDPDDWSSELLKFPYVNGGLFADPDDKKYKIPQLTSEIKGILVEEASAKIDWSKIDPAIFGALFESTLNQESRRSGGMHYTTVENIHKVIDPLFLNDLNAELSSILQIKTLKTRNFKLREFQKKLGSLTFLDPACGSGNFLTEVYCCLRRIENKILRELYSDGNRFLGSEVSPITVSIQQFYGIEINDFAVAVARTALWIAESQMMDETVDIVGRALDFLPLKAYPNICEANALEIDWNEVVPKDRLSYVISNPPFVGAMMMTPKQRQEIAAVFSECKCPGEVDYVAGWYAVAKKYIRGTECRCAFVSTNSICQGQQVDYIWRPLFNAGLKIDFAYRTFVWDNDATKKAHVHCVIVGFSAVESNTGSKIIFKEDGLPEVAENINPYLVDAPTTFIMSRGKPLCDAPAIRFGSMPRDGGHFILSEAEKNIIEHDEPLAKKWIKLYLGAREFIHNKKRWCLWLKNADPAELAQCKIVKERVALVKEFREKPDTAEGTRKFAKTPTLFCQIAQPDSGYYIAVPENSSSTRFYLPLGFISSDVIASNLLFLIPNAGLYHFGVLMSSVHNTWMRAICGRLKSDYRYSKDIVYNNFPWCEPSEALKAKIEQTAQGILDARALFPDCSLADLYDSTDMREELRNAHIANDHAVLRAYGLKTDASEKEIVEFLFKRYEELTKQA